MSHDTYELKAEAREQVGKGSARAVRRNGKVPAVIYGDKQPPLAIALSYKDIFYKIHGGGFLTTPLLIFKTFRGPPRSSASYVIDLSSNERSLFIVPFCSPDVNTIAGKSLQICKPSAVSGQPSERAGELGSGSEERCSGAGERRRRAPLGSRGVAAENAA